MRVQDLNMERGFRVSIKSRNSSHVTALSRMSLEVQVEAQPLLSASYLLLRNRVPLVPK